MNQNLGMFELSLDVITSLCVGVRQVGSSSSLLLHICKHLICIFVEPVVIGVVHISGDT